MRFKKLIAAISAAAMLLPALPIAQAATKNADVRITGAAVVRSTAQDFLTNFTNTTDFKSAADQIQIFSNATTSRNGSQCGAYYKYEIPEYEGENLKVTLELTKINSAAKDTLRIIKVGTDNISNGYTTANIFEDVKAAYTANANDSSKYIEVGAVANGKYTVDISGISNIGTNALFVYTRDYNDKDIFYTVSNASISMTYEKLPTTIWSASDETSTTWNLSTGNDKVNGYANVTNGELTTTMVADATIDNSADADVQTAYKSAAYKGTITKGSANSMGMIATAGNSGTYLFRAGKTYTLHYTLSGSWDGTYGAYVNVSTWTNERVDNWNNYNNAKVLVKTLSTGTIYKTYDFQPNANSYAQFNFIFRGVNAGDTMTVSNIYVTTDEDVHTVTFDSNGGSAVAKQIVYSDETVTEPAEPKREGYIFKGWQLNGADYTFGNTISENIELTAKWKATAPSDVLSEEKIDLTNAAVKIYNFPLSSTYKKFTFGGDVTSNEPYKYLVDGIKNVDAEIPKNNYVMIDLGDSYPISTIKAYQATKEDGHFVSLLSTADGKDTQPFVKADLQDLIRTNSNYLEKDESPYCYTYSVLSTRTHNMGNQRYIIIHNGADNPIKLSEIEIYKDTTVKENFLSVNNFYADHMVLQRDKKHVIKGYSATGTSVTVTMTDGTNTNTRTGSATPVNGNWSVSLDPLPAGTTPYTITVSDDKDEDLVLKDVLVGDVFLASGQSNMAYDAPRASNQKETQYNNINGPDGSTYYKKGVYELQSKLANQNIRFIKMRDDINSESGVVTENVPVWVNWSRSDSMIAVTKSSGDSTDYTCEGILQLSTLAAFYADKLVKDSTDAGETIPVGIIQATYGGTAIEKWIRGGRLYNNHIAPLDGLNAAGILWYQGCANSNETGFATYYDRFKGLIQEYRRVLGNDQNTPFMYVQLAPYKNNSPELKTAGSQRFQVMREIQREMLDDTDVNTNLYMAVSMDTTQDSHHDSNGNIVNASLIHPLGKDTLGVRMANAYKAMASKDTNAVINGPLVDKATVEDDTVTVTFKEGTADGLTVVNPCYKYQLDKDGAGWQSDTTKLEEFKLAGEDGVYYDATAVIEGKSVKVTSKYVTDPKYVSYAYSELPKNPNLGNGAGLPASPFNIGMNGESAPATPFGHVEFTTEKASFSDYDDKPRDAYIFTAEIANKTIVKIGAGNGTLKYLGSDGSATEFSGGPIYFGVIAEKDSQVIPVFKYVGQVQ